MQIDKALITRQRKRLDKLQDAFLACRVGAIRHHWERVLPDWLPSGAAIAMAFQCSACRTVKRYEVDPKYGIIIGTTRYEYPDGYKLRREEGDGSEQLVSPNAVRAVMAATRPPDRQMV